MSDVNLYTNINALSASRESAAAGERLDSEQQQLMLEQELYHRQLLMQQHNN